MRNQWGLATDFRVMKRVNFHMILKFRAQVTCEMTVLFRETGSKEKMDHI